MKKYSINVHYDIVISVCVVAKNENEAIRKAKEKAIKKSLNTDAEYVGESACITDIEEI